jgi:hypothetical protein
MRVGATSNVAATVRRKVSFFMRVVPTCPHDEAVLRGVDEVENPASGLSRKIWRKITILDRLRATPRHAQS